MKLATQPLHTWAHLSGETAVGVGGGNSHTNAPSCLAAGLKINSQLDFVVPESRANFRAGCANSDWTMKAGLVCQEWLVCVCVPSIHRSITFTDITCGGQGAGIKTDLAWIFKQKRRKVNIYPNSEFVLN